MLGGPTTSYSACSKKQKLRITLAIMQNLLFSYKSEFSLSLPFQLWYFACCIGYSEIFVAEAILL